MNFNKVNRPSTSSKAKTVSQWTKGETYVGYLKVIREEVSRYGAMKLYVFADADSEGKVTGSESSFTSSKTLDSLLSQVQINQLTQIVCLGKPANAKSIHFEVNTADAFLPTTQTA